MTAQDRAVRAINFAPKQFTILDIARAACIEKDCAIRIVTALVRKGHLRKLRSAAPVRGHRGYSRYELVRMIPARAPLARTRIWRSMRIMRRFTLADLVATADAGLLNAKPYLLALVRGGYVRKVKKEVPQRGVEGRAVFALIKDTGPLAPKCGKGGAIVDPNLEVVEGAGGSGCGNIRKNGSPGCAPNASAPVRQPLRA